MEKALREWLRLIRARSHIVKDYAAALSGRLAAAIHKGLAVLKTLPEMAHQVFISYAYKDKPVADAVCAVLESEAIRCWIAPRDVLPGADYTQRPWQMVF